MSDETSGGPASCEHSSADHLFLYLRDQLDAVERRELEQHLSDCEECRERESTLRWIAGQVEEWGSALFADHVRSEELVRYAEDRTGMPADLRQQIERHLLLCQSCTTDLRMVEEVGSSLAEPVSSGRPALGAGLLERLFGWLRPAPAWATALLLLLLLPAGLGIRGWLAGEEDPLRFLPAPQVLESTAERAGAQLPVLVAPPAGPMVVEIHVPMIDAPDVRYDARLLSAEGRAVWQQEDLESVDDYGSFLLLLDPSSLDPAPYRLELLEIRPGALEPERFEFAFRLERP